MLGKYLGSFNDYSAILKSYWVIKNIEIENVVKIEIENKLPGTLVKPTTLVIICCPRCRIMPVAQMFSFI